MVSAVHSVPDHKSSSCGLTMTSAVTSADASTAYSSEAITRGNHGASTPKASTVADHLGIDAFNHAFPPMPELNIASMFASHKKKTTQPPILISSSPPTNAAGRSGVVARGSSLAGGFATECNSLSSFDLEYALLEQALKKDGNAANQAQEDVQARPERKTAQNVLEPEFYFSDILGDNGLVPHPIASDPNHIYSALETCNEKTGSEGVPDQMDADLSSALASLVGSDVSTDLTEDEAGVIRLKPQMVSRSSSRLSHESSQTNFYGKGMFGGYYIPGGNSSALRDLRNIQSAGRIAKHRKRHFQETEANFLEKSHLSLANSSGVGDDNAVQSPVSDNGIAIGTHPDIYENLSSDIREKVDRLQSKISMMPRRKLRESLALGVSIEDVEPLMCVNRDELAGMLGLGVTTWKMFVHHTLGIPRWPARALKSQQVKEKKLLQKKLDAQERGEYDVAERIQRELTRLTQAHLRRRKLFRNDVNLRASHHSIAKKGSSHIGRGRGS